MRYAVSIDIDLPRAQVIELFDDADNLSKWQDGLLSFEHVKGAPGQVGAVSQLTYKMGKSTMEMMETITERNFPDSFSGTYEADGVHNTLINQFIETGPTTTRWNCETAFRFDTMGMKLMAFFLPFLFKNQTRKFMQNFKTFAETGKSVSEG